MKKLFVELELTLYNICFANFRGAHAPHAPSKSATGTDMRVQYIQKGNRNVCSVQTKREQICVFNTYKRGTEMFAQYIQTGTAMFVQYIQTGTAILVQYIQTGTAMFVQYIQTGTAILVQYIQMVTAMCVQYIQKGNSNVSSVHANGNSNVCSIHTQGEKQCLYCLCVCLMLLNATFNNISVISWRSFSLVEKTTNLSQVTDKPFHIMLYTSPWSRFELTTSVAICTYCIEYLKHKQQLIKFNKYSTITY